MAASLDIEDVLRELRESYGVDDPFRRAFCEGLAQQHLFRRAVDVASDKPAVVRRLLTDVVNIWHRVVHTPQANPSSTLVNLIDHLRCTSKAWLYVVSSQDDITWEMVSQAISTAVSFAYQKADGDPQVTTQDIDSETSESAANAETFDRVYDAVYTQLKRDPRLGSLFKDRTSVHELWDVVSTALSDRFEDVQFNYENDLPGFVDTATQCIIAGWCPAGQDIPDLTVALIVAITGALAAESMGSEDENGRLVMILEESDILDAYADEVKACREAHAQAVPIPDSIQQQIQEGEARWKAAASDLVTNLKAAKTKQAPDPSEPALPQEGAVEALPAPVPPLAQSKQAKAARPILGFGQDEIRNLQSMLATHPQIHQLSLDAKGVEHTAEVFTEIVLGWGDRFDRAKRPDMYAVEHAPSWVPGVAAHMATQELYCDLYRKKQIKKNQVMAWVLTGIQEHLKREQLRLFEKEARYIDSTVPNTKLDQDLLDLYMAHVSHHLEYAAALESHHPILIRRVLMAALPEVKSSLIKKSYLRQLGISENNIFIDLLHEMSKYPRFTEQITTKVSDPITEDVELAMQAIIDRAKHRLIVDEELAVRKLTDIKPPNRVLHAYLHHLCENENIKLLDHPKSIIVDALLDARSNILAGYVPNDGTGEYHYPSIYEEVFVRLWQSLKFRDWMQSTEYGYSDHELDEIIGKAMLMVGIHHDDKQKEDSVNEPQPKAVIPDISLVMWAAYLSAVAAQPLYDMGTLKTPSVIVPIIVNALREVANEADTDSAWPDAPALEPYREVFTHLWTHVPKLRRILQNANLSVETSAVEAWVTEAVHTLASVSAAATAVKAGLSGDSSPSIQVPSLAEEAAQLVSNDHEVLALIPPGVSRYALQEAIKRALSPLDTSMSPEMIQSLLPTVAQELLALLPAQGLLREPKKIIATFNIDSHGVVSRQSSSAAPNDVMKPMEENAQGSQIYFGTTNGKNLRFCISDFDIYVNPEYPDGYVIKYAVQHDSENPDEVPPEVKEFSVPLPFTELTDTGLRLWATKLVNVILNRSAVPDVALIPRDDIRRALHRRICSYLASVNKATWIGNVADKSSDLNWPVFVESMSLQQDPGKPEEAILALRIQTRKNGLWIRAFRVPAAGSYSKNVNVYASKLLSVVSEAVTAEDRLRILTLTKEEFTRVLAKSFLALAEQAMRPLSLVPSTRLTVESSQTHMAPTNEGDSMSNSKDASQAGSPTQTLTQEETFLHARKREMGQVLKRTGARQLVKFMQEEIAAALRRNIDPTMQNESVRVGIATFLEGDLGKILVGGSIGMLGAGIIPIPDGWASVLNPLFEELRIEAGAQGGDMAADMIGGPVRKALARWIQNEGPKYAAFKDLPGMDTPGELGAATGPNGADIASPTRAKVPSGHDV